MIADKNPAPVQTQETKFAAELMERAETCPICEAAFKPDDLCATDIELGVCHAQCLEGSPVVDLDTGEETGGTIDTYQYSEVMDPLPVPNVSAKEAVQACLDIAAGYWKSAGDTISDIDRPSGEERGRIQAATAITTKLQALWETLSQTPTPSENVKPLTWIMERKHPRNSEGRFWLAKPHEKGDRNWHDAVPVYRAPVAMEPVAAYTVDFTGCYHMSCDIA
ncbi:hypothetical protein LP421_17030 [Rhizobium sp. RCAM05350]|nr:hypothetical protein LP421_17030 [Rhizobium sp. RCAM05350]